MNQDFCIMASNIMADARVDLWRLVDAPTDMNALLVRMHGGVTSDVRPQADISAALTAYLGPSLPVSISYGPAGSGSSGGAALAVSVQFPPNNQLSATVVTLPTSLRSGPSCNC